MKDVIGALSDAMVKLAGPKQGIPGGSSSPQWFLEGAVLSDLLIPAFQEAGAQKENSRPVQYNQS